MNFSNTKKRNGFTLTEVLVAVTLTLILLGLMIRIFAISGGEIAKGRALLEMAGQLRSTAELLRRDLKGATAQMLPRNQFGNATGYFEYIEGPTTDNTVHTFQNGNPDVSAVYGDVDDIIMFTCRSLDQPFRGRFGGQVIESNYAEICWWTVYDDNNNNDQFDVGEELKLFRRVLLIRPDLTTTATDMGEFLQFNDLSVRLDPNGNILANTLSDLSDRANRFARAGTTFPHEPNYDIFQRSNGFLLTNPTGLGTANLSEGEDVILSGLAGFDVQVFDPVVQVQQSSDFTVGLIPSDFGYNNAVADISNIQFGGYVDLSVLHPQANWNGAPPLPNNGIFTQRPRVPLIWQRAVYDTWSQVYESDGLDQDNDGQIDEGTNELDDDNANGPDDVVEYETQPPYPFPLRGVRISLRLLEPTTKVIRQTSVISNFVPE